MYYGNKVSPFRRNLLPPPTRYNYSISSIRSKSVVLCTDFPARLTSNPEAGRISYHQNVVSMYHTTLRRALENLGLKQVLLIQIHTKSATFSFISIQP